MKLNCAIFLQISLLNYHFVWEVSNVERQSSYVLASICLNSILNCRSSLNKMAEEFKIYLMGFLHSMICGTIFFSPCGHDNFLSNYFQHRENLQYPQGEKYRTIDAWEQQYFAELLCRLGCEVKKNLTDFIIPPCKGYGCN